MFGAAAVDGIQTRDTNGVLQASSEVKHGFVYNLETDRKGFDANVSKFDLMDTYLPPFAATLPKAKAYMCSVRGGSWQQCSAIRWSERATMLFI